MKNWYLLLDRGSGSNTVYSLIETVTIGRSSENTVTLSERTVSHNHARVRFLKGDWILEDLESTNGIMLGGRRVERVVIKSGDSFYIGRHALCFIEKESFDGVDRLSQILEILFDSIGDEEILNDKGGSKSWSRRIQRSIDTITVLRPLKKTERKKLVDAATLHAFNAREMIIREGNPGRSIYVVLDGQVRVFTRDHYGRALELAILGESQFFGEIAFLTGNPRSSSVESLDKSLLLELDYTNMLKLIHDRPPVKQVLLEYYHERTRKTEEKRSELQMEERRLHPRLNAILQVHLSTPAHGSSEKQANNFSWTVESVDISMKGIMVAVPKAGQEALQAGAQVRLEIELPPPRGYVHTLGVIRRINPSDSRKRPTLLGIEFVDTAEPETKKLREFIYGACHIEL